MTFAPVPHVFVDVGILLALSTPWLIPACLRMIPSATVLRHSALAEAAATLTKTGDFSTALREYRPDPARGRRSRALPRILAAQLPRSPLSMVVTAFRTPSRAVVGLLLVIVGTAVLALGLGLPHATPVDRVTLGIALVAGLALIHGGIGAFADSVEFATETAAAMSLFRLTSAQMLLRTGAMFALLVLISGAALVAAWAGITGAAWALTDPRLIGIVVLGLVQVSAAKVFAATKGPLPAELTTPIPSPGGDISVLFIALWQIDALALGPVAAGAVLALGAADPVWLIASALISAFLVRSARQRLRN